MNHHPRCKQQDFTGSRYAATECPFCRIEVLTDRVGKLHHALLEVVESCPTGLDCEDFSHHNVGDTHEAEEDCPPCCRYYGALYEAEQALR